MTLQGRKQGVVYELIEGASASGGGGGGGGGPTCSGVPSQADFYGFMIDAALPFSHVAGNPSQCVQDWQYSLNDAKYYIFDNPTDGVMQRDQKWLVLWRNPASQIGTTLTVPLRPLNVGDGTVGQAVPVGWTHPTVSYVSGGTPTQNGYGPHPMTQGGHALVAQSLVLPADLASVKLLTWNTLSKQPVDSFSRADNPTTLGSNWTIISNSPQIVSGKARSTVIGGGGSVAWWSGTSFQEPDQFSRLRLAQFTGGAPYREVELFLRMQSGGQTFYEIGFYNAGGGDRYYVARVTIGVPVILTDAAIGANLTSLDLLEATATGTSTTTIKLYRNQVLVATVVDASGLSSAGAPGFGMYVEGALTDIQIEEWQGGHLHGPSPTTEVGRTTYGAGNVAALANLNWAIPWGSVANGMILLIDDHADPAPTIQTYPSGGSFAQWFTRAGTLTVS